MRRAVFLDRDGVINRAIVCDGLPFPPASMAEVEILLGVGEALRDLRAAGYMLIVITNQPDVARGITSRSVVEDINSHLASELPLDDFYTCYHDTADNCVCRKPKPGAILDAAERYGIDLKESYMVGDRWRDTEAGQRAGCKTIFIKYGYAEKQPESVDYSVASLSEAAKIILGVKIEIN